MARALTKRDREIAEDPERARILPVLEEEVAELTRDHATTFKLADETIFSKLEILEEEVRKTEAEETILFADASLLLRGEYYDIEERILNVGFWLIIALVVVPAGLEDGHGRVGGTEIDPDDAVHDQARPACSATRAPSRSPSRCPWAAGRGRRPSPRSSPAAPRSG